MSTKIQRTVTAVQLPEVTRIPQLKIAEEKNTSEELAEAKGPTVMLVV
jgi:hypothetical protein